MKGYFIFFLKFIISFCDIYNIQFIIKKYFIICWKIINLKKNKKFTIFIFMHNMKFCKVNRFIYNYFTIF